MLYHTSLLTGVAGTKQPVPVVELGAGTPVEAVAFRLVAAVTVQVVPGVRAMAPEQLSLAGACAQAAGASSKPAAKAASLDRSRLDSQEVGE